MQVNKLRQECKKQMTAVKIGGNRCSQLQLPLDHLKFFKFRLLKVSFVWLVFTVVEAKGLWPNNKNGKFDFNEFFFFISDRIQGTSDPHLEVALWTPNCPHEGKKIKEKKGQCSTTSEKVPTLLSLQKKKVMSFDQGEHYRSSMERGSHIVSATMSQNNLSHFLLWRSELPEIQSVIESASIICELWEKDKHFM